MRTNTTIVSLLGLLLAADARADFNTKPACMDGIDNDHDGKTDMADPGCDGINDDDETDLNFSPKVKARLAIIFDTSGSMKWNVCTTNSDGGGYTGGDGSAECPGDDVPCCHDPVELPPEQCHLSGDDVDDQCDSTTCGNGVADDARIAKVRRGVFDAVAAYGEIEYSLYRYHMSARNFDCNDGDGSGTITFGGWRGATDSDNCGGADQLVRFGPENQDTLLMWIDGRANWSGSGDAPSGQDFEVRPSGFTPIAGSISTARSDIVNLKKTDPAGSCRPYRIVVVTDGQETCGGDAPSAAQTAKNAGIPVYVVGFATSTFQGSMDDIASSGGTTQAFLADDPASLSNALAQIVSETVLVEKCNGMDDDCDGVIDNGFNVGDTCDNGQIGACFRQGTFECVSDTETACNAPHVTPGNEQDHGCNGIDDDCDGIIDNGLTCAGCGPEICNGADDDCDGTIDDGDLPGVGEPCQLDVGECTPGHLVCKGGKLVCEGFTGPTTEVCDGKDNNCDGVVDQISRACYDFPSGCNDTDPTPGGVKYTCQGRCRAGVETCVGGKYGNCAGEIGPTAELCNGIDDDCDGKIDEDFTQVGQSCEVGVGLCHTTGHYVCAPDGKGVVCDAVVVTGSTEVCNGVDDDCDGVVDNLPVPAPAPIGESCGTCGGTYQCKNGQIVCIGGSAGQEICNGQDDDCNGIADDGDVLGVGVSCVPGMPPLFVVRGECKAGTTVCAGGKLQCVNYVGPQPEVCNGKDDDCDGVADDMAACPDPNDACYEAQCVNRCGPGEFPCPFGLFCKQIGDTGYCVPSKCVGKTCPEGMLCDQETGECSDPCVAVHCPTGSSCVGGRCFDCFTLGCPTGQVCQDDANRVASCVVDKCATVTCGTGQTCNAAGACVAIAASACGATSCGDGEVCDSGKCVPQCAHDLCFGAHCTTGYSCNPATGRCIADPCIHTNCGDEECGLTCQGDATCGSGSAANPNHIEVLATGAGGFACEIGQVARGPWWIPLAAWVFLALVLGRRRSRGA